MSWYQSTKHTDIYNTFLMAKEFEGQIPNFGKITSKALVLKPKKAEQPCKLIWFVWNVTGCIKRL